MIFFDFLYYIIYTLYATKEKGAASTSAAIVGGLQAMNVFSCCMFISTLFHSTVLVSKMLAVFVVLVFQVTTYLRYLHKENRSIAVLEEMWEKIDDAKKVKFSTFGLLYVILSFVILIGVAVYAHEKLY